MPTAGLPAAAARDPSTALTAFAPLRMTGPCQYWFNIEGQNKWSKNQAMARMEEDCRPHSEPASEKLQVAENYPANVVAPLRHSLLF